MCISISISAGNWGEMCPAVGHSSLQIMNNYKQLVSIVDSWLSEFVRANDMPPYSRRVCEYVVSTGGKRVRPVLTLLVADMLGIHREKMRSICISIELLHSASLVHDDLPALDNDDVRRGQPACHKKFGEGLAVVIGDRLISMAFDVLANDPELPSEVRVALLSDLARTTNDLCDGQILDLFAQGKGTAQDRPEQDLSREQSLELQHKLKTGALIRFAAAAPARLLDSPEYGAREKSVLIHERLGEFGAALGLLFQITDDVLDATSESGRAHGGHDLTYTSVYGVERAHEMAREAHDTAVSHIACFGGLATSLVELSEEVLMRSA